MKRYRGIKYSFRPKSYWGEDNVLQALLRDVKGAERRKMIKAYYEGGNFQELEESFTKASLSDEERFRLASIHPMFMGGEYLPDCNSNETEIARVTLRSTMQDVISIRAKEEDGELHYSVDRRIRRSRVQPMDGLQPKAVYLEGADRVSG